MDSVVEPQQFQRIGAQGFGLNQQQQEAIADLWRWQRESLDSKQIIGGPLNRTGEQT